MVFGEDIGGEDERFGSPDSLAAIPASSRRRTATVERGPTVPTLPRAGRIAPLRQLTSRPAVGHRSFRLSNKFAAPEPWRCLDPELSGQGGVAMASRTGRVRGLTPTLQTRSPGGRVLFRPGTQDKDALRREARRLYQVNPYIFEDESDALTAVAGLKTTPHRSPAPLAVQATPNRGMRGPGSARGGDEQSRRRAHLSVVPDRSALRNEPTDEAPRPTASALPGPVTAPDPSWSAAVDDPTRLAPFAG
jgi:hypothetical protein